MLGNEECGLYLVVKKGCLKIKLKDYTAVILIYIGIAISHYMGHANKCVFVLFMMRTKHNNNPKTYIHYSKFENSKTEKTTTSKRTELHFFCPITT